ncbi:MAG TPA: hypothetical protein VGK67_12545 [Myxococcales bacterium]|jgi:hypothetical protein
MKSRMGEVGIMANCALGILTAVALTLGMGGVVAAQLNQTFSTTQLEPRSPGGRRGVVLVQSGTAEVLDQCLAQCDPVSSPALACQSTSQSVDSGS